MTQHRPATGAHWDQAADLEKDPARVPQLADTYVPAELRREIEAHIAKYPHKRSAVLPALEAAQRVHGWCSPQALEQVAAVMAVTPAYLSSIVTFYDMLKAEPAGVHDVYVCTSVACHLRDAKAVFDAIASASADAEEINVCEFECLGACDMAPMASVDGRYIGPLDPSDAPEIVSAIRSNRKALPGRGLEDADYRLPENEGAT